MTMRKTIEQMGVFRRGNFCSGKKWACKGESISREKGSIRKGRGLLSREENSGLWGRKGEKRSTGGRSYLPKKRE